MKPNEYFSDQEIEEAKFKFAKTDRIHALLARLETVEAMEPYWKYYAPLSEKDEKQYDAHVKAQRKAAGK